MADLEMISVEHPDIPGQVMLINAEDFDPVKYQLYTPKKQTSESENQKLVSDTGAKTDGSKPSESGESEPNQEKSAAKPRALKKPAAKKPAEKSDADKS